MPGIGLGCTDHVKEITRAFGCSKAPLYSELQSIEIVVVEKALGKCAVIDQPDDDQQSLGIAGGQCDR